MRKKNTYNFNKKVRIGRKQNKNIVEGIVLIVMLIMLFYPIFAS